VGASKWLQPSLHQTLRELASKKVREICVVPVAFVSDHVETLGEINHEAREEAYKLGITHFEMSAGLNDSPKFISALGQLVLRALGDAFHSHSYLSTDSMERQAATPELLAAAGD
jgi:ferrochelatase